MRKISTCLIVVACLFFIGTTLTFFAAVPASDSTGNLAIAGDQFQTATSVTQLSAESQAVNTGTMDIESRAGMRALRAATFAVNDQNFAMAVLAGNTYALPIDGMTALQAKRSIVVTAIATLTKNGGARHVILLRQQQMPAEITTLDIGADDFRSQARV